jgi:hypothetical protein
MPSRRLATDVELLHSIQQHRTSKAEARHGAMRPADHPVGVMHDPEDVPAFDLCSTPSAT